VNIWTLCHNNLCLVFYDLLCISVLLEVRTTVLYFADNVILYVYYTALWIGIRYTLIELVCFIYHNCNKRICWLSCFPITLTPILAGSSRATAGPRETFLRGPQTFSRGPSGKKIFAFFFSEWYILAYFIFLADGGAPKRHGARGSYPTISMGLNFRRLFL